LLHLIRLARRVGLMRNHPAESGTDKGTHA
jgi:hypothetical protein